MNNYKIGLWGALEDAWIALMWSMFYVYCVIKRIVDHVPTLAVEQQW